MEKVLKSNMVTLSISKQHVPKMKRLAEMLAAHNALQYFSAFC